MCARKREDSIVVQGRIDSLIYLGIHFNNKKEILGANNVHGRRCLFYQWTFAVGCIIKGMSESFDSLKRDKQFKVRSHNYVLH